MEFTSASENVVIQAALEIRHGGPWWVPTVHGKPRITKPPLAAWISAAAMSDSTVAELSSSDPLIRQNAYQRLAFEVRAPAALSSALMLLGVYALGTLLLGPGVGLVAAIMAGTSLLLFRYGRTATTDVQIALWTTWANVCLAGALLRGRRWLLIPAGLFLGLGIMSKGPVCLVQSVLPAAIYLGYLRSRALARPLLFPALLGIILMLAIALPWPLSIMMRDSSVIQHWFREITRVGATELKRDSWYSYVRLVPNMMPWAPLVVGGVCAPFIAKLRNKGTVFAWLLVVVPVLIMSLASDKPERYAMPMIAPLAVLAAYIAVYIVEAREQWTVTDKLVVAMQWLILLLAPLGIIALTLRLGSQAGYAVWIGSLSATVIMLMALGAWILRRRYPWGLIAATAAGALIIYPLVAMAYAASPNGHSSSKPLADALAGSHEDFRAYYLDPRPQPRHVPTDLGIYLNRPIVTVSGVDSIAPGTRPALIFMLQRPGEPMPVCPDSDHEISKPVEGQMWHVFRLRAGSN